MKSESSSVFVHNVHIIPEARVLKTDPKGSSTSITISKVTYDDIGLPQHELVIQQYRYYSIGV